jgi:hypothetical protein
LVYVPKVDFAELVSKLHIFSTTASTVTTVALLIVKPGDIDKLKEDYKVKITGHVKGIGDLFLSSSDTCSASSFSIILLFTGTCSPSNTLPLTSKQAKYPSLGVVQVSVIKAITVLYQIWKKIYGVRV